MTAIDAILLTGWLVFIALAAWEWRLRDQVRRARCRDRQVRVFVCFEEPRRLVFKSATVTFPCGVTDEALQEVRERLRRDWQAAKTPMIIGALELDREAS